MTVTQLIKELQQIRNPDTVEAHVLIKCYNRIITGVSLDASCIICYIEVDGTFMIDD